MINHKLFVKEIYVTKNFLLSKCIAMQYLVVTPNLYRYMTKCKITTNKVITKWDFLNGPQCIEDNSPLQTQIHYPLFSLPWDIFFKNLSFLLWFNIPIERKENKVGNVINWLLKWDFVFPMIMKLVSEINNVPMRFLKIFNWWGWLVLLLLLLLFKNICIWLPLWVF